MCKVPAVLSTKWILLKTAIDQELQLFNQAITIHDTSDIGCQWRQLINTAVIYFLHVWYLIGSVVSRGRTNGITPVMSICVNSPYQ